MGALEGVLLKACKAPLLRSSLSQALYTFPRSSLERKEGLHPFRIKRLSNHNIHASEHKLSFKFNVQQNSTGTVFM
jgi:hypothetical protein